MYGLGMKFARKAILPAIVTLIGGLVIAPTYAASNSKNDCTAIDGNYIVVLNKGAVVANEVKNINGRDVLPKYTYGSVFNGYSAFLTGDQVCQLQKRPTVALVEEDSEVFIDATTQSNNVTWGLDRIDEITSTPATLDYVYTSEGSGVDVYIVDTGIKRDHAEFSGRVAQGWTFENSTDDCNGHGTHVAGTIGGTNYGVAKKVNLIPVRVFGCSGSTTNSVIIQGLDWITNNHSTNKAVTNMSLGGKSSSALDLAVQGVINDGVVVVVAAGNSKQNACNFSPARVQSAITVAASDSSDKFASYSNFGTCVDLIAPGTGIKSAWISSADATNIISGTSMASPHVAGAVARYLSSTSPSSNTTVSNDLKNDSTKNAIKGLKVGTLNNLLYIDPSK